MKFVTSKFFYGARNYAHLLPETSICRIRSRGKRMGNVKNVIVASNPSTAAKLRPDQCKYEIFMVLIYISMSQYLFGLER